MMESKSNMIAVLDSFIAFVQTNFDAAKVIYEQDHHKKVKFFAAEELLKLFRDAMSFPEMPFSVVDQELKHNIQHVVFDPRSSSLSLRVFDESITIQPISLDLNCPYCGWHPFSQDFFRSKDIDLKVHLEITGKEMGNFTIRTAPW